MLCDMCGKREAIVFIHQVGAEEKKELHLCAQCAYEHGLQHLEGDVGKALSELLKSLSLDKVPTAGGNLISKQKKRYPEHCSNCGVSLQDIKKNPIAGCESCWNSYADLLLGSVTKQRVSVPYKGRFSVKIAESIAKKQELDRLEQLLHTAVVMEDYEQAAIYRDRIRLLKQGEKVDE